MRYIIHNKFNSKVCFLDIHLGFLNPWERAECLYNGEFSTLDINIAYKYREQLEKMGYSDKPFIVVEEN